MRAEIGASSAAPPGIGAIAGAGAITARTAPKNARAAIDAVRWHPELWAALAMLVVCNPHLFGGPFPTGLVLFPDEVAAGRAWQLVTHPFVHVSWWHLILNATTFVMLYAGLGGGLRRRLASLAAATLGSALAAATAAPLIDATGLCGLSGPAHGLLAIYGLETMATHRRAPELWHLGLLCLVAVVAKTAWEATTGRVVFAILHLGKTGVPIAVCHAGGVLGGLIAFLLAPGLPSRPPRRPAEL